MFIHLIYSGYLLYILFEIIKNNIYINYMKNYKITDTKSLYIYVLYYNKTYVDIIHEVWANIILMLGDEMMVTCTKYII